MTEIPRDLQNKDTAPSKERFTRAQKEGLRAILAGVALGIVAGGGISMNQHRERPAPDNTAKQPAIAEAPYRATLEQKLRTAYVDANKDGNFANDISIESAEKLDKTVRFGTGKRGVIKIHINGSAKNKAVAESEDIPEFSYGDRGLNKPINQIVAVNGKELRYPEPALADWQSQETGEALLYPRLDRFASSQPTTLNYKIQLGANGYLLEDGSLRAVYEAGDVLVTGSNGAITDVDVIPRDENAPSLHIIETKD